MATTFAGGAFAADLPSRRAPQPAYVAPAPIFTWTGLYVGINGGGWINDSKVGTIGAFGTGGKLGGGGFEVGGTLGYNMQMANRVVVGIETDLDYRSKANVTPPLSVATNARDGYIGTTRLRLGYGFDRVMIYATGGLAYGDPVAANTLWSPALGVFGSRANGSGVNVGWTAGGGAEFAVSNNWSVKGEYLYTSLGAKGVTYNTNALVPMTVANTTAEHNARVGVNYRFGFGGAPVVGRY